ncbi:MAG: flagellar biosynthetic protein FliR [Bacillota bacterium]
MPLDSLNIESWLVYLMIWARLMGIVFLFPFFSWRGIPFALRLWLSLVLALLLFLSMEGAPAFVIRDPLEMVILLVKEVMTGLALGYLVMLFFSVFLNAGLMVDLKSGLMLSGVFDPQFGSQVTFMGQFYYLLSMVFYLTLNGHHYFLQALADSYTVIPLGTGLFARELAGGMVRLFADLFYLAFQIVAPVAVILLLMDVALGLIAKTVPQVHVFIEGLPLKIALSLLLLALMVPLMGVVWENILARFIENLVQFMQGW